MFILVAVMGTDGVLQTDKGNRTVVRSRPDYSGTLELPPSEARPWGDWGFEDYCMEGQYVNEFWIKLESCCDSGNDDTAMNSIMMNCNDLSTTEVKQVKEHEINSIQGPWGTDLGKKRCLNGYMTGFKLYSDKWEGSWTDDIAASNLKMGCEDGNDLDAGGISEWGSWSSYQQCPSGSAICGLQTRVYPKTKGEDNVALCDVKMFCCYLQG